MSLLTLQVTVKYSFLRLLLASGDFRMTSSDDCDAIKCRCTSWTLCWGFVIATIGLVAIVLTALMPRCATGIGGIRIDKADTFDLPDLSNLSNLETNPLLDGKYPLPHGYYLRMDIYSSNRYKLCVLKNPFEVSTTCLQIGRVNISIPCNPEMRVDCLSGAIIDRYFGITVWNQAEASIMYLTVDITHQGNFDFGVTFQTLTNTTISLSEVWYRAMECQTVVGLGITVLLLIVLYIISSAACIGGECLYYNCHCDSVEM